MALNFPSSPTNGQTYTDGNNVRWEYDGTKWNVTLSQLQKLFSGAKILLGSNVALTATNTAISFGTESYDTDSYFATSANTKITVNRNGFYRINSLILTDALGSGSSYTVNVVKNGATNLTTTSLGPNQSATYDEIVELVSGDYIEIKASESGAAGSLLDDTMLEVVRLGLTLGTGITQYDAFSGVRATLSAAVNMTSTATGVSWAATTFDGNADITGANYWSSGSATRLTVGTTGYFRIKSFVATGTAGSSNSYTIAIKKNGSTTLATINMSANETLEFDEIYSLSDDDYIELVASNSGSVGTLLSTTYLELVRLGV